MRNRPVIETFVDPQRFRGTCYKAAGWEVLGPTQGQAFAVTTLTPEKAGSERLLQLAREHWSVENGQHHRRDRTQRENSCTVRDSRTARNLGLFRSLSIFLFAQQRKREGGKASLPELESCNHSHPWNLLHRLMDFPQARPPNQKPGVARRNALGALPCTTPRPPCRLPKPLPDLEITPPALPETPPYNSGEGLCDLVTGPGPTAMARYL